MALDRELAYFEAHRAEWLEHHEGKWAVIKGEELAGFYDDFHQAVQAGYYRYGVVMNLLIKQVLLEDKDGGQLSHVKKWIAHQRQKRVRRIPENGKAM